VTTLEPKKACANSPLSMAVCQDTPSFNSVGRVSSPPDLEVSGKCEDADRNFQTNNGTPPVGSPK